MHHFKKKNILIFPPLLYFNNVKNVRDRLNVFFSTVDLPI